MSGLAAVGNALRYPMLCYESSSNARSPQPDPDVVIVVAAFKLHKLLKEMRVQVFLVWDLRVRHLVSIIRVCVWDK